MIKSPDKEFEIYLNHNILTGSVSGQVPVQGVLEFFPFIVELTTYVHPIPALGCMEHCFFGLCKP